MPSPEPHPKTDLRPDEYWRWPQCGKDAWDERAAIMIEDSGVFKAWMVPICNMDAYRAIQDQPKQSSPGGEPIRKTEETTDRADLFGNPGE